jgi:hypothetical protein
MPAELELEPDAARSGGRDFAALADRCRSLAAQLGGATRGIDSGPRAWSGGAARSGSARGARLAAALGQAAGAAEDVAGILSVFAAVVQDAAGARGSAERLARAAGCRLAPDGAAEGVPAGDTGHALLRARAEALAGQASDDVMLAARIAAAGFAEVAARAAPTCALVGRRVGFSSALERRLHGPVSAWDDVRQGVARGLLGMVTGAARAIALGSPQYWVLRPREAWRLADQTLEGGLFALRRPGDAARQAFDLDDLENGHAWRFWAQFVPQAAAFAVTKGVASLAREAAAVDQVSATVEQASIRSELPIRHTLADINPGYPSFGRNRNCASCALATDATLAGRPASALPGGTVSIGVLEGPLRAAVRVHGIPGDNRSDHAAARAGRSGHRLRVARRPAARTRVQRREPGRRRPVHRRPAGRPRDLRRRRLHRLLPATDELRYR